MSKVNRRKHRRPSEVGALQILEEAFHLTRSLDVKFFWVFYLGAVPFAVGLLYFVADMSRSSLAARDAAFAALGMAVLYFWMRYCQARFCAGLWETLSPGQLPKRSRREQWGSVVALWFLHSMQVPLLVVGIFFAIPLGWILATQQNFSALAMTQDLKENPLRSLLIKSIRYSHYEWAQNHGILLIFCFVSLFTWINIIATCVLVPGFGKSFFGIESIFTVSPTAAVMNTTFLFGSFLLMQLLITPLMNAAYVLRCFYAGSRSSGADLLSRLASARETRREREGSDRGSLAKVALIVLLAVICGSTGAFSQEMNTEIVSTPQSENAGAERLRTEIAETLEQKKYQWQFSRRTLASEKDKEQSWISLRLHEIADTAKKLLDAAEKWFETMMKKLMKRGMKGPDLNEGANAKFLKNLSSGVSLALVLVILGLLVWLVVSLYRKYRGKPKAEIREEGFTGVIDLESEEIVATQLREDEWMRLAREQIEKGDARLAVRALFLGTLAHLGELGMLRIARFKSNRDYRTELTLRARSQSALREAFDENTVLFESAWYGLHQLGADSVDYFLRNHEMIVRESNQSSRGSRSLVEAR